MYKIIIMNQRKAIIIFVTLTLLIFSFPFYFLFKWLINSGMLELEFLGGSIVVTFIIVLFTCLFFFAFLTHLSWKQKNNKIKPPKIGGERLR